MILWDRKDICMQGNYTMMWTSLPMILVLFFFVHNLIAINCSHAHKGDYLVYTNNKLFYEPKLRFEYCTEQLDDPSFLHSFSCSSFENLHPDSDLSYRSQFDTSFSLLQGGHSFIHTHYSSKTTTTLDDYPFLLSLYQSICYKE